MMTTNLYSKRFTPARGWHWELERGCNISTANDWLEVFQKDEPTVEFKISKKTPKLN